ncbi:hypothetical protein V1264_022902 [Littorina saxatilis]|uniref:Ferric-chelate reductase 1 n=1 Tax=Littorina saxatilis TaxID=31220 RepID=A0AAN9B5V2_9CAEN
MPSSSKTLAGTLTVLIGLLSHCGHVAHAYSSGAPSSACVTMLPIHGPIAQQVPSPYVVNVSSVEVLPSGTVTVTISGDDFKGFMVTAYSSDFAVGTMVPLNNQAKVVCNALSITHTGSALKPNVTFQWTAPGDMFEGTLINFKATIVKERVIFWTGILSAEPLVYVETSPDLPQSGGTSNSTTTNDPGSVLLPTATTTIAPGKTNQFPGHLASDTECGKSKACFHDCEAGKCTFIVSWDDDGDVIVMSMTYRVPDSNEHWVAVGFSKDQEMGDDSVTECIMHDGEVKVQQSYNDGMDNKYLDNKKAALSEQSGKLEDGLLHCTFHRKKSYPRDPLIFDLNNDYYLMVAVGEALNGIKIPHTFDVLPPVSDHRIDLQAMENVAGEEPPTNVLVQIHGALMIISWVMLMSIGITTAKYGKAMFPKINPFGVNIWFQIHRACLVTAAVLTVIAVLIMAVQCKGYCQIPLIAGEGKNHWPLHPVLGLLVLVLTVINVSLWPAHTSGNCLIGCLGEPVHLYCSKKETHSCYLPN